MSMLAGRSPQPICAARQHRGVKSIRILFAGGHGFPPEITGGVQSSTDHLVRQCRAAGHDVAVLAALFGDKTKRFGLTQRARLKLSPKPFVVDTALGYKVMRSWFPWDAAPIAVEAFRPDVAVVQSHNAVRIGHQIAASGVPVVLYFRNVEYWELGGKPSDLPRATFIANSQFTRRAYFNEFGVTSTVIPPTIDPAKYTFETTREYVTLINVHEEKGFEKAVQIAAACPEIEFLFVENWKLDADQLAAVLAAIKPLPNVTFRRRTEDMSAIYGRTGVLLAPSKWEEAWGRVASEAHCSGIPVLGSSRGGLPEAIGPGGVILDYDAPLEDWASALRRLWTDKAHYAALSAAARAYAQRPELRAQSQFETFMTVLNDAAAPVRSVAA